MTICCSSINRISFSTKARSALGLKALEIEPMKIGILGTRGIPNHYGGFEQFAEYLSVGLVARGHEVVVYNSSTHPYQKPDWNGVQLIHCFDPEHKIGTVGQFVYDYNCIRDARKRGFDVLLQLGYTSSSLWAHWLPEGPAVFTNMDGLEWKRSKYGSAVKRFLKRAEEWAVKSSDVLIADSTGIADYLREKYRQDAEYIAYGAEIFKEPNPSEIEKYNVEPDQYFMLIARMEPENNIEMILKGYVQSGDKRPFIVVGKTDNRFGKEMVSRFGAQPGVRFTGGVYNMNDLNNLRHFAKLYFHGHSVGGTNPSLLEAMASGAYIAANDNPFNRAILGDDALYFESASDVNTLIPKLDSILGAEEVKKANQHKIENEFRWDQIIDRYESVFVEHSSRLRS